MLQGNESNIQVLLGHYAHSLGYFHESALHFIQASKVNGVSVSPEMIFVCFSAFQCLNSYESGGKPHNPDGHLSLEVALK